MSENNRRQVLNAAAIVAGAFVLNSLLGLLRETVISRYYGLASLQAEAWAIANPIPEWLFTITAGGAIGSAFVPTFAGYFARDDKEGAWRLFSAIVNLVILLSIVLAGVAAIFAPQIIEANVGARLREIPGLREQTVLLLRVLLISNVFFGAGGVVLAALQARQHFLMPALAANVYNIGIIVGTIWLAPDVLGLGVGVVAGSLGFLLIQLPALVRHGGRYQPVFTISDPGVREVLRLMAPRVLGLSLSQFNAILLNFVAQGMAGGALRAIQLAIRLVRMPNTILGISLGTASFPTLAALAAEGRRDEMRRIVGDALRLIFFLGLPIVVLLAFGRVPIVALLNQYGAFDANDTQLVSWALLFAAPALLAWACLEVVARTFYALKDTVTPVTAGAVQLGLMVALSWLLGNIIFPQAGLPALGGVALGFSLSNLAEVAVLLWLLRRKLGGLGGGYIWAGLRPMVPATAVMAAVTGGISYLWPDAEAGFGRLLLELLVLTATGGGIYVAICYAMGLAELQSLLRLVNSRLLSRFRSQR